MVGRTAKPILDVLAYAKLLKPTANDPEYAEYFVPVEWKQTVGREDAIWEPNWFANQNSVARPTAEKWVNTIAVLKKRFKDWNK